MLDNQRSIVVSGDGNKGLLVGGIAEVGVKGGVLIHKIQCLGLIIIIFNGFRNSLSQSGDINLTTKAECAWANFGRDVALGVIDSGKEDAMELTIFRALNELHGSGDSEEGGKV
jgi:hypothetical protein